ncbi:GDSL-type esterase/lipase family protein [Companilactobacillus huachuanensis]|uniref:GDSL-type esterase/lipase family protein n=1 Tax=Companilactobacillus huachuanensis TaxID=2559914 RepID=A0ABW1RMR1_9LACO|nr:GDSL-type esterase/lipase family protein [Companilactobacillus huachuanensis]
MIATTTWKHNLTNYQNIENINRSGFQHLEIVQPLATDQVRLQLNNLYDEVPLKISKLEIYSNSANKKLVTFEGSTQFTIEPRLIEWSDWIDISLPINGILSIDIYSPNKTIHSVGLTISNDLIKTTDTDPATPKYFFGISAIQVAAKLTHKKIAFFGDSLTNQGNYSAPLSLDLETNFQIMTANFGISGNRLLRPGHSTSQWSTSFGEAGLTRFDHMLANYQPNIVVFMEGLNDLLHPGTGTPISELPTAEAIVKATYILKAKCRKHDARFVPMTITPFGKSDGWTPEKEILRQNINTELLKMPHILDVSELVGKDNQLLPEFDCGDHVHFSAAGGKIIAKYIKEQLIRKRMI